MFGFRCSAHALRRRRVPSLAPALALVLGAAAVTAPALAPAQGAPSRLRDSTQADSTRRRSLLDSVRVQATQPRALLSRRTAATGGSIEATEIAALPTDARDPIALKHRHRDRRGLARRGRIAVAALRGEAGAADLLQQG
ncbi:MAG: hypothetical protein ACOVRP_12055, partial [Gemmatimonas sp.]